MSGRSRSSTAPSSAKRDEGRAAARGPLALLFFIWELLGEPFGKPTATGAERTEPASRAARRADRGAEIHHGLGVVAGVGLGREAFGQRLDLRLGGGERRLHRKEARDHALDIAVDRRGARPEGNGSDGRRGIAADAGKLAQLRFGLGEVAAVLVRHDAGAGMEVAGAGVVAEPGPDGEHLAELGAGERLHVGPAAQEIGIAGRDRLDRGLLQHDLAEPDFVRVCRAPGGARQGSARASRPYQASSASATDPRSSSAVCVLCISPIRAASLLPMV